MITAIYWKINKNPAKGTSEGGQGAISPPGVGVIYSKLFWFEFEDWEFDFDSNIFDWATESIFWLYIPMNLTSDNGHIVTL